MRLEQEQVFLNLLMEKNVTIAQLQVVVENLNKQIEEKNTIIESLQKEAEAKKEEKSQEEQEEPK